MVDIWLVFDYQKLTVFQKAQQFNRDIRPVLKDLHGDSSTRVQLRRAGLSIVLNIAESSSRFTHADRKHFLVISRGSAFECGALLEYLKYDNSISIPNENQLMELLEQISKMLFAMIRKLE